MEQTLLPSSEANESVGDTSINFCEGIQCTSTPSCPKDENKIVNIVTSCVSEILNFVVSTVTSKAESVNDDEWNTRDTTCIEVPGSADNTLVPKDEPGIEVKENSENSPQKPDYFTEEERILYNIDDCSVAFDSKIIEPETADGNTTVIAPQPEIELPGPSVPSPSKDPNDNPLKNLGPPIFISDDPQENEDNCNPAWEEHRKLTTDEQRYKAVRDRWRNSTIPNPKGNLTRFNYRSKVGFGKIAYQLPRLCRGLRRPMKTYSQLFDSQRNETKNLYHQKIAALNKQFLHQYAEVVNNSNDPLNGVLDQRNQIDKLNQDLGTNKRNVQLAYCDRLRRIDEAEQELCNVHKFYFGLTQTSNRVFKLTEAEYLQWIQLDQVVQSYLDCYR